MKRALAILILLALPGWVSAQVLPQFYSGLSEPVCTVAPAITGDTVGDTLTVSSTWTGQIELTYAWYVNDVATATTATFDTSALQAGDVVYVRVGGLNASGFTYANSSTIVLAGAGNATVESATINSAGDTLTVVLSSSDTVTDATGWSVSFDNYAQRALTYSSGSGTDTFVFDISANPTYTDADTDNDAAPVGTVCLMSYDADTGNAGALADVGGYSVTNNSTAHPDPDLPEQVDTSLPANWNDPADYTPADNAALQALVNGSGIAGKVVELTAGVDYGYINWAALDGGPSSSAPTIFRTSEWDNADFPAYGESLPSTINGDPVSDYMPTISRTITSGTTQVLAAIPSVNNVRFIGINWESRGVSADPYTDPYSTTIQIYGTCDNVIFDRCRYWWQDELLPVQGFDVDSGVHGLGIIDGRFENFYGQPQDSSPIWLYAGKVIKVSGNYINCISNGCFTADNGARVIEDVTFVNNYVYRDPSWSTGHGTQKAGGFESKGCKRLWITGNRIENTFNDSWPAITIKAEHASNRSVHTTITFNKITSQNHGRGIVHHINGSINEGGPNTDLLIAHNLIYDNYYRAIELDGSTGYDRIKVVHNTLPNNTLAEYSHFYYDGSDFGRYLICKDNIVRGYGAAIDGSLQGVGSVAFNSSWYSGLYEATHNVFFDASSGNYDSDTSPLPEGVLSNNRFPAFASVGFIDASGDDYRLTPGSAYSSTGTYPASDGTDRGADITTLNTIMTTVEE